MRPREAEKGSGGPCPQRPHPNIGLVPARLLRAAGRDQKGSRRQGEQALRSPSTLAGGRCHGGTRPTQGLGNLPGFGDGGGGASPAKPGNSLSLEATPTHPGYCGLCLPRSLPRARALTHGHTHSCTHTWVDTSTPTGKCNMETWNLSWALRSRTGTEAQSGRRLPLRLWDLGDSPAPQPRAPCCPSEGCVA